MIAAKVVNYAWDKWNDLFYHLGIGVGLPHPSGQYSVASKDVEAGDLHVHLFYPTVAESGSSNHRWVPSWSMIDGYAIFLSLSNAYHWIISVLAKTLLSHVRIPTISDSEHVHLPEEQQTLPLVIFSHGLASWGTAYSALCYEIASRGYVVAAVDHQDGSATAARRPNQELLMYISLPSKDQEENLRFRNRQLRQRCEEIVQTRDFVMQLSNSPGIFFGKLSTSRTAVIGHSFGGCTALASLLASDSSFQCGIALDGWMDPLDMEKDQRPCTKNHILCLNCDSGSLSGSAYWKRNVDKMKQRFPNATIETISGSHHTDISDPALLFSWQSSLLRRWSGSSSVQSSPLQVLQQNVTRSIVFLNRHLIK